VLRFRMQPPGAADTTLRDFFQLAAVFAVDPATGEQAPFAWGLAGTYTAVEVNTPIVLCMLALVHTHTHSLAPLCFFSLTQALPRLALCLGVGADVAGAAGADPPTRP
jgi:hypothetical protein